MKSRDLAHPSFFMNSFSFIIVIVNFIIIIIIIIFMIIKPAKPSAAPSGDALVEERRGDRRGELPCKGGSLEDHHLMICGLLCGVFLLLRHRHLKILLYIHIFKVEPVKIRERCRTGNSFLGLTFAVQPCFFYIRVGYCF